ncbi:hypothetical protein [Candidatus Enterococcus clewellii]|uniref:Uncharacterized protein n=1 Tax=Candidatus Enterococcus clewellii TaxID=1834193 RepID=A0A242K9W2_9ENTE|nr:hypothetical protein [Enterococcus sp. 9E7_DIV0242]OTP17568.1 hypothetical protein A5888_001706 [Enterococcus sp. 9E7_DIV0242]
MNENQQIVFTWLKACVDVDGDVPIKAIFILGDLWQMRRFNDQEAIRVDNAYAELTEFEQYELLAAFAEWGSKKFCKDCGCEMAVCADGWKDQRKCCPDCKCTKGE